MEKILLYFTYKYEGDWQKIYKAISKKEKVENKELEKVLIDKNDNYITILDDDYPSILKQVSFPPFVIFYKGNKDLLYRDDFKVAVIGSRENSEYGKLMCEKLTKQLIEENTIIISGLAIGIDSIAHKTCVANKGKTIAVLGSGIDYCYPIRNKKLYEDIIENEGLIISEYPGRVEAVKENFPFRNRLIAAFSTAILVIEAKKKSGTMITVAKALQIGKDIFCVPERANIESGCNILIKSGAKLVEDAKDILEEFPYYQK